MIRRPPRSTLSSSSAASDVYKRQLQRGPAEHRRAHGDPPPNRVSRKRNCSRIRSCTVAATTSSSSRSLVPANPASSARRARPVSGRHSLDRMCSRTSSPARVGELVREHIRSSEWRPDTGLARLADEAGFAGTSDLLYELVVAATVQERMREQLRFLDTLFGGGSP